MHNRIIPKQIKEAFKVIGYFAYTVINAFCDSDACIIAGSEALMKSYLQEAPTGNGKDIIKKTKFGEIIEGMRQGGAYAFDKESYKRFKHCAELNGIYGLPTMDFFEQPSPTGMHFIRIKLVG